LSNKALEILWFSTEYYLNTSGTDVMVFNFFSPKTSAKKLAFLTQNKAKLGKKIDHNIGF
jgi:hypothetical protein